MKLSPNHLKRYQEIARLFWKYGRSDLVTQMGLDEAVDPKELKTAKEGEATPDQLADDLEAMGPTYVKLGQILSGRPDLLPEAYLKALARLQGKVKPFSFAEVEEIVTSELGVRISKAFSRFDAEPIAAASLGHPFPSARSLLRACGHAGPSVRTGVARNPRPPAASRAWNWRRPSAVSA